MWDPVSIRGPASIQSFTVCAYVNCECYICVDEYVVAVQLGNNSFASHKHFIEVDVAEIFS